MENIKIKKIGTFTFGFCLIILGISAFLSMFMGTKILQYTLYAWPIVLILIGVEVLYYNSRADVTLKYDILGTFLLGIIFIVSIFGSMASQALNEFIQNKEYYIESFKNMNETHYIQCTEDNIYYN